MMKTNKYFHGVDVCPSLPADACFHVIPVPLEQSVSYGGGTSEGPAAILEASAQLETLTLGIVPADLGLYTAPPIDCEAEVEDVLLRIGAEVTRTIECGALPVVLGGEHTVSAGVIESLKRKYSRFGVVQFDAHADLRTEYGGTPYSHASVMRRVHEQDIPIFQIGTRSYSLEETDYRGQHTDSILWLDAEKIHRNQIQHLKFPDDFPENIYISFDIDALDTAIMPATGTPAPGGLSWYQAMWLLRSVLEQRRCIGFDVVEFAPIAGQQAWAFTAAQLVYNMMAYTVKGQGKIL